MFGEKTLAELAQQFDVHPNLIDQWRSRLLGRAADVFGAEPATAEPAVDVKVLHAKIGDVTLVSFWHFPNDSIMKVLAADNDSISKGVNA